MFNLLNTFWQIFFPVLADEDANLIPAGMTNDCIAQSWYRFLHSLGNPVDLSRPAVVSQTQHFYQYAIVAENVVDPTHHPCLSALPSIFLKAMKGTAAIVDAYLGEYLELHSSVLQFCPRLTYCPLPLRNWWTQIPVPFHFPSHDWWTE